MADNPKKVHTQKSNGDNPYNGKILLAAVVLLSIVIFFVLLLHIYARWLLRRRPAVLRHLPTQALHRRSSTPATVAGAGGAAAAETRMLTNGVDAKALALLPVFVYKSKQQENDLECVVCLGAMEEGEAGRLLPRCSHAFHVACVDMWLASHSTCPICRTEVRTEEAVLDVVGASPETEMAVPVAEGEEVVEDDTIARNNASDELIEVSEALEGNEVVVDLPMNSAAPVTPIAKENESSSISSSCGPSLRRILSRSISERSAFSVSLGF